MLNETVDFWIVFPGFESERFDMSQLNVNCSRGFRNQVFLVGRTTNKMPTLIVAASRPWPRHLKSTSASLTSMWQAIALVRRAPRPGVWWAPQNR